jgi:hypothetical protein
MAPRIAAPFLNRTWPKNAYHSPGISGWDTHNDNFNTLLRSRLPITDQTVSALLEDLDGRGLLD